MVLASPLWKRGYYLISVMSTLYFVEDYLWIGQASRPWLRRQDSHLCVTYILRCHEWSYHSSAWFVIFQPELSLTYCSPLAIWPVGVSQHCCNRFLGNATYRESVREEIQYYIFYQVLVLHCFFHSLSADTYAFRIQPSISVFVCVCVCLHAHIFKKNLIVTKPIRFQIS